MNAKEVVDVLRKIETKTPVTLHFDNVIDEHGDRVFGQKKKRWWDENQTSDGQSRQQYHVIAFFICRYYNGIGYPSKCKDKCNLCFSNENYKVDKPINPSVVYIYNIIQKPEMYIWLIEALKLLEEEKLKECVNEIKYSIKKYKKVRIKEIREIVNRYVTWADIERRLEMYVL